jgi:hypothetical protein
MLSKVMFDTKFNNVRAKIQILQGKEIAWQFRLAPFIDLPNVKVVESIDFSDVPDVFIWHRTGVDFFTLARLKSFGVKLIYSIDDYWDMTPTHTTEFNQTMILTDSVIVASLELYKEVSKYNKNVYFIANKAIGEALPKTESDKLRVGLVGSISHLSDYKVIKELIELIKQDNELKELIEFSIAGITADNRKLYTSLLDGYVKEKPWLPLNEHLSHYQDLDILLCPLEDTQFNRCRSGLKLLEAAATDTLAIGSSLYLDKEVNDIIVADTVDEYLSALKAILANPSIYQEALQAQKEANVLPNTQSMEFHRCIANTLQLPSYKKHPDLHLYSICYSPEQIADFQRIENNTKEKAWRFEYNVFIDFFEKTELPDNHYVGIFSWKLYQKTMLSDYLLQRGVESAYGKKYIILSNKNTFKDTKSYLNFSYRCHPNLKQLLKQTLHHLKAKPIPSDRVVYSNNIIMTVGCWKDYIENWVKPALEYLEGKLWNLANTDSKYKGVGREKLKELTGLDYYNHITFVLERLILYYLKTIDDEETNQD